MHTLARLALVCLAASLLLLSACDSGDPDDEIGPEEVSGRYDFHRFEFTPSASGVLQPIDVLDTLVVAQTSLDLSADGFFFLSYSLKGGGFYTLRGEFEVTPTTVHLQGDEDQRASYQRIFLSTDLVLRRSQADDDVLTAAIQKTINPSEYSDRYKDIQSVGGTLHLRLSREASD